MLKLFSWYILSFASFLVIDLVWLGYIAKNLYQQEIGHLLGPVNWPAAFIFYLIYVAGVMYFAVNPNLAASNMKIFVTGGLLGALCYATYDLTNLATLKDFSINIVPIDIAWGFVLTGLVALCSAKIYNLIY